jgi:very-short-patch-repair endonuclease
MTEDRKLRSLKPVSPALRERSHELRQAMSGAEQSMWANLRAHRFYGFGFRRQVPIAGFIVDFACHEQRLIVEVDGTTHGEDDARSRDEARTRMLEQEGYCVVRYWNNDVMGNLEGVLLNLASHLGQQEPPPNPPPQGGRAKEEEGGGR